MKIAIRVKDQTYVTARKADINDRHICPICGCEVTIKRNPTGVGQCFAHGATKGKECEDSDRRVVENIVDLGKTKAVIYAPGWKAYRARIEHEANES